MSNQSKYLVSELYNEHTSTGGANTDDWIASMRGMVLLCADSDLAHEALPANAAPMDDAKAQPGPAGVQAQAR